MSRFETWLRKHVPFKEIGWTEIGGEIHALCFMAYAVVQRVSASVVCT